jgi:hypothetical protein
MKTLARITLILRHLASHDSSFAKAKAAAESALVFAIRTDKLTAADVKNLAAILEPDIQSMSTAELSDDIRHSLRSMLIGLVGRDAETYDFFNAIERQMPKEERAHE